MAVASGAKKMEAPIKAGYMEELRFGKRQQWAVAAASIALIAGAFHMADGAKPLACWEKWAASILVSIVAVGGIGLILSLQNHLASTRRVLDRFDNKAWRRGMSVVIGIATAMLMSAVAVAYSLWRV
jgi:hypothetical protein